MVVTLAGSSGGVDAEFAPALAEAGWSAFAVALFAWEGRQAYHERIALEWVTAAVAAARAEAGRRPVALLGRSRGAEAALLAAALAGAEPDLLIAVSPFDQVTPGWTPVLANAAVPWTVRGEALAFSRVGMAELDAATAVPGTCTDEPLACLAFYERMAAANAAPIPIERVGCPMLLIGGEDDRIWPASPAAARLAACATAPVTVLALPDCGHAIAPPDLPPADRMWHAVENRSIALGGTPEGNAAGAMRAWQAIVSALNALC